jgi:Phage integrase family
MTWRRLSNCWRRSRLLIPVILGVLCGMRRGEIIALRWRQVDFINAQLAVVESAEQTGDGVRYKQPKSGRSRTVALSAFVLDELRAHRLRQAEELLKLGARQNEATFVYTRRRQACAAAQPNACLAPDACQDRISPDQVPRPATCPCFWGTSKGRQRAVGPLQGRDTLDLYSHVLPGMQADAAAHVDDALRGALQK